MSKSTTKKSTAKPKVKATSGDEQHPSLADQPEPNVEVAHRSQDVEKDSTPTHRKTYVLLKEQYDSNGGDGADDIHLANIEAARQAMIHQGLRPTSDGKFAGSEDHPDGKSINLHYDIPAVPAVVALGLTGEQSVTHAHVTLDDQHAAEKAEKDG